MYGERENAVLHNGEKTYRVPEGRPPWAQPEQLILPIISPQRGGADGAEYHAIRHSESADDEPAAVDSSVPDVPAGPPIRHSETADYAVTAEGTFVIPLHCETPIQKCQAADPHTAEDPLAAYVECGTTAPRMSENRVGSTRRVSVKDSSTNRKDWSSDKDNVNKLRQADHDRTKVNRKSCSVGKSRDPNSITSSYTTVTSSRPSSAHNVLSLASLTAQQKPEPEIQRRQPVTRSRVRSSYKCHYFTFLTGLVKSLFY